VLGGSAAYAVGETFRWPLGLERKVKEAKAFYAVLAFAALIGLVLNCTKIDPIKALVWTAIIDGVTAAPVMVFMMLMPGRRKTVGESSVLLRSCRLDDGRYYGTGRDWHVSDVWTIALFDRPREIRNYRSS
jgi:Mn2+/Fe2+ NRAMP family transporter